MNVVLRVLMGTVLVTCAHFPCTDGTHQQNVNFAEACDTQRPTVQLWASKVGSTIIAVDANVSLLPNGSSVAPPDF